MKLSTRTRYGTRAMLELALNYGCGLISAREIAARQALSPKYLEHLLASLRSADLVRSVRGVGGGHVLNYPPDQITLRQIHDVFEGRAGFVECTTNPELCDRADVCATNGIWSQMHDAAMEVLESTTLADLASRARMNQGDRTRET